MAKSKNSVAVEIVPSVASVGEQCLAVAAAMPSIPDPVARMSLKKPGKVLGYRQYFTQSLSAKEINEKLKVSRPGMSSKERAAETLGVLRGEKDIRNVLGLAWVQTILATKNGIINYADETSGGAVVRIVKAAPAVERVVVQKSEPSKAEMLAALGISEADLAMAIALKSK